MTKNDIRNCATVVCFLMMLGALVLTLDVVGPKAVWGGEANCPASATLGWCVSQRVGK